MSPGHLPGVLARASSAIFLFFTRSLFKKDVFLRTLPLNTSRFLITRLCFPLKGSQALSSEISVPSGA